MLRMFQRTTPSGNIVVIVVVTRKGPFIAAWLYACIASGGKSDNTIAKIHAVQTSEILAYQPGLEKSPFF